MNDGELKLKSDRKTMGDRNERSARALRADHVTFHSCDGSANSE